MKFLQDFVWVNNFNKISGDKFIKTKLKYEARIKNKKKTLF